MSQKPNRFSCLKSTEDNSTDNNRTNRFQYPNLQKKKIFIPELNKSVTIKLSVRAMKIVDKLGLMSYMKKQGLSLADIS